MDGKARATDSMAIERFWRSAKHESIDLQEYKIIAELKQGVRECVEFYNHKRFHQALGDQEPMEAYQRWLLKPPGKAP
jgi:putative transposase